MYEQANRNINTLLGVKKTTKKNTFKTTDMKTIKTFATKGNKYKLELIKDNFGYCIKSYKNDETVSTDYLGNCSLAKAFLEIENIVKNSKYFDNINYIGVI